MAEYTEPVTTGNSHAAERPNPFTLTPRGPALHLRDRRGHRLLRPRAPQRSPRARLPPREAVRVEEFLNYFRYRYPAPEEGAARGAPGGRALALHPRPPPAARGRAGQASLSVSERKPAHLVFLVDVSRLHAAAGQAAARQARPALLVDNLHEATPWRSSPTRAACSDVLPPTGLEHKAAHPRRHRRAHRRRLHRHGLRHGARLPAGHEEGWLGAPSRASSSSPTATPTWAPPHRGRSSSSIRGYVKEGVTLSPPSASAWATTRTT